MIISKQNTVSELTEILLREPAQSNVVKFADELNKRMTVTTQLNTEREYELEHVAVLGYD